MKPWDARDAVQVIPQNVRIWEGPSAFDGEPILVIASGRTSNRKIGAMVQIWILRADLDPIAAAKVGKDFSVCGDCRHRGVLIDGVNKQRACYVELMWGPRGVHKAWEKALRMSPEDFAVHVRGKQVRIGAYGDPAAVPAAVWAPMIETCAGWTAYTHQWRTAPDAFKAWCMASVDSVGEQISATELGWRTFRVRRDHLIDPVRPGEVICPASKEGHYKTTCEKCSLCRGNARPAKSITIVTHGSRAQWFGRRTDTFPELTT